MSRKNIVEILKKYGKEVWVMYNQEGNGRLFNKYITSKCETSSIAILSKKKSYIIIASLDKDNIDDTLKSEYEIYVYSNKKELAIAIEEIIADLKFPKDISLSYSSISDLNTDLLTHGSYLEITKLFKEPYKKYNKKIRFSSAEQVIYELETKKSKKQIERLKYLANVSLNVLEETFKSLKIGMSENEIVYLTRNITDKYMMQIIKNKENHIVGYDMAWADCPIVLVGENLAKGGHSLPSDKKLKKGDTIYFDFGINALYDDGESLYTDMQRMGYALKDKENDAPKSVKKVFRTLVNSIEDGIENLRPGKKGYEIDKIVRDYILKAGYPDYSHATGHPVGVRVHDIGTIISTKLNKRAHIELVEDGIYTLEPRVNIPNGGSIEEMILVTKYGGIPLCKKQSELYFVK